VVQGSGGGEAPCGPSEKKKTLVDVWDGGMGGMVCSGELGLDPIYFPSLVSEAATLTTVARVRLVTSQGSGTLRAEANAKTREIKKNQARPASKTGKVGRVG
jgi:hypothetical protein